jgi:hypothetical protein
MQAANATANSPVVPRHCRFDQEANPKSDIHVTSTDQHRKHDSGWHPPRIIFGHHLIFSIVTSSAFNVFGIVTSSADVLTRNEANRLERRNGGRHRSPYYEAACSSSLPNTLPVAAFTRWTARPEPHWQTHVSAACIAPARAKRRMRFSARAASPCLLPLRIPRSAAAGRSNSPGSRRRIRSPGRRVAPWSRRLPR